MLSPIFPDVSRYASSRRGRSFGRLVIVAALAAAVSGCAASASTKRGQAAERQQDYDRAIAEYTKALRLRPGDLNIRMQLDRAKLRSSEEHFQRGRRLAAVGKHDQALVEYELAAE